MKLTKEITYKEIRTFFKNNLSTLVVFGTGLSCSIDPNFGMNSLKEELISKIPNLISGNKKLEKEWGKVIKSLNSDKDLESSLNNITNEILIKNIVKITGDFVASLDEKYAFKLFNGDISWTALKFLKKLVDKLPKYDRTLHVVTSNYDMLAEYAFESEGLRYINGFVGGVCRNLDWDRSIKTIKYSDKVPKGKRVNSYSKDQNHIRLYKVHGSLNTFLLKDNKIVENNAWTWSHPADIERVIITPGIQKFERITEFRDELLRPFDDAVKKKNAFIFLGYGFNDKHIEQYIIPKLKSPNSYGMIITRDNNEKIESLCTKVNNIWLICKQKDNDFTRIRNKNDKEWLLLPDLKLWDIEIFTKEIFRT